MQENQNISLGYNLFMSTLVELNCRQVMERTRQFSHVNSEQTWKAKKPPNSIPLNLSVYIRDEGAARRPPTQNWEQAWEHTSDCGEQTEERGDLYLTKRVPALRAWQR